MGEFKIIFVYLRKKNFFCFEMQLRNTIDENPSYCDHTNENAFV